MEKIFRYRRFNIVSIRITMVIDILFSLFVGFLSFARYPSLAIIAGILLLEGIMIGNFAERLSSTEVKLTDEGLSYSNNHRTVFLKYEDITKIDSRSVKYTGGWFNILSASNKPIRLTITLQGIGELILGLKEQMDSKGLSDRYDEKKLFSFFRTATYCDQSWERGEYFFTRLVITSVVQLALVIWILNGSEAPKLPAVIFIGTCIVGIIPFLCYEYGVYARAYKKMLMEDKWIILPPDRALDRRRMKAAFLFYLASAAIGLLAAWLL